MKGYAGKIGIVDLGSGKVETKTLEENFAKEWLGGNGFGIYYLNKFTEKGIDPLSPGNALIFVTGPLVGTTLPRTGKFGVYTKSPQTGFLGESYCGGGFGPYLKYAGFDVLIVKGKTEKPSYLNIAENIEIKSAEHLWGKGCYETEEILLNENKGSMIACIGPAGENEVLYACIHSDFGRQAGRTGIGAVMGSKNLKGIVVNPSKDLEVHDLESIQKYMRERNKNIVNEKDFNLDIKYGTGEWIKWMSENPGCLPTKNFQQGTFDEVNGLYPYEQFPKYVKRAKGCMACNQPCGKIFEFRKNKYVEGPEYETLYALGSDCDNPDMRNVAEANYLCDDYGLDTISCGAVIAWAMEASEKGIIKEKIDWDHGEELLGLIKKIAFKEGIGKELALGVKKASEKLGGKDFAIHVKGLEFPAYDVRGIQGLGLSFAEGNRGACHLRSCFYAADLSGGFKPLGISKLDRFEITGKASAVIEMENLGTVYDCLIMCKFNRGIYTPEELCNFVKWTTGFECTGKELLELGGKIWDMERAFNVREGLTKKDDNLPKRMHEPQPAGGSKGHKISKEDLKKALGEYYKARGWDLEGKPK